VVFVAIPTQSRRHNTIHTMVVAVRLSSFTPPPLYIHPCSNLQQCSPHLIVAFRAFARSNAAVRKQSGCERYAAVCLTILNCSAGQNDGTKTRGKGRDGREGVLGEHCCNGEGEHCCNGEGVGLVAVGREGGWGGGITACFARRIQGRRRNLQQRAEPLAAAAAAAVTKAPLMLKMPPAMFTVLKANLAVDDLL